METQQFANEMANSYGNVPSILFPIIVLSHFHHSTLPSSSAQATELITDPAQLARETTPGPETYAGWTDWEEWVPAADVAKAFPYYKAGFDNDGLPSKFFHSPQNPPYIPLNSYMLVMQKFT